MGKFYSLLPLVIFLLVFIGGGLYFNDFYALPSVIPAIVGIVFAFVFFRSKGESKWNTFLSGCGDVKIITMCMIYLLSGAFTVLTKSIGSIDLAVHLGVYYFSESSIFIGVFLISCILSFAIGTSVGTIVTLAPIVYGISEYTAGALPLLAGSVLAGAMFGDNLSLISDTTIAATQSMGVSMKSKFFANFKVAGLAALIAIGFIYWKQPDFGILTQDTPVMNWILLLPYVFVIVLAILGLHVFVVLFMSILCSLCVGFYTSSFTFLEGMKLVYEGFLSMNEIFILSLLMGGLASLVEKEGGIVAILNLVQKKIQHPQAAFLSIALIVSLVTFAVANNTIALILCGPIALQFCLAYNLNKSKVTAILDVFSCVVQGILPYGAQMLLLIQLTHQKVSYQEIVAHSYYLFLLLALSISMIFISSRTKVSNAQ